MTDLLIASVVISMTGAGTRGSDTCEPRRPSKAPSSSSSPSRKDPRPPALLLDPATVTTSYSERSPGLLFRCRRRPSGHGHGRPACPGLGHSKRCRPHRHSHHGRHDDGGPAVRALTVGEEVTAAGPPCPAPGLPCPRPRWLSCTQIPVRADQVNPRGVDPESTGYGSRDCGGSPHRSPGHGAAAIRSPSRHRDPIRAGASTRGQHAPARIWIAPEPER
jgi:hypothetical protein